jgi:hypothetical protein
MSDFVKSFADTVSDGLKKLKTCTDLSYLKKELEHTEKSSPDCAAESLYRTNKLSIITHRIKELEDELIDLKVNNE